MSESPGPKDEGQAATESEHREARLIELLARLLARRWREEIGHSALNRAPAGRARQPRGSAPRSEPPPPDAIP